MKTIKNTLKNNLAAQKALLLVCAVVFMEISANSVAAQKIRDLTAVAKPTFRIVPRREMTVMDADGNMIGEPIHTFLEFKIGNKTYRTFWESAMTSPPVYLSRRTVYKFLIRPEPGSETRCEIVKIWRRGKLIWTNPEFKK